MEQIKVALIGAGDRGARVYGSYALEHPDKIQFVAVAEPNDERRDHFKKLHQLDEDKCFVSWEKLIEQPRLADAVLICTQDKMHFDPTIMALERGYHILLEKPMSTDPKECIQMGAIAKKYQRVFMICHVLRFTGFFHRIKGLLDLGRIGKLVSIQHNENVGYYHYAHSYVRGNWRNSKEASPMILAKSCHDMDIMLWLVGADCKNVSSFGSLTNFKKENAPEGAPHRCIEGCPVENDCPYFAPRIYLTENTDWPVSVIADDMSIQSRVKAIEKGPYGRCVFRCDNNVVDHQVVNLEFENGVTAAFTMSAFTGEISRTIKLMGTKGEIRGHMEKSEIEVIDFLTSSRKFIGVEKSDYGHSGGDLGIMEAFVKAVTHQASDSLSSADSAVQSHLMAFAAEKARVENKVVIMENFIKELR